MAQSEARSDTVAAQQHVHAVVNASGSSFSWAMRFLPKARRQAIFAVYAFCREVDDVADGAAAVDDKRTALDAWREEIDALYSGVPSRPTTRALLAPVQRFDLDREAFLAIIDGMEMDARGPIRGPSMAELELYCDRVAGAVGRLCVKIFGEGGPAGRQTAETLGLALQLTNILRDLKEDAARGRLYLPRELLDAEGITERRAAAVLAHPRTPAVCDALADKAMANFDAAEAAIAGCRPEAFMRPAIIMMMVYRKTLERLMATEWTHLADPADPDDTDPIVSKAEKLLIALRYGLF